MKEQHLARSNKVLLIVHTITFIFMTIGLISQLALSGMKPIMSIFPLVVNILVYLASLVAFFVTKGGHTYALTAGIGYSIAYSLALLLAASNSTFPYIIPFILLFVIMMDSKMVAYLSIVTAIVNLIRIITIMASAADPSTQIEYVMIETIIVILIIIVSNRGLKLIKSFFEGSMAEVESAMSHTQETNTKIVSVAADVENQTVNAVDDAHHAVQLAQSINDSMNNISSGINAVVDAIIAQTDSTQNIQEAIDDTSDATAQISDLMSGIEASLNAGVKSMEELMQAVQDAIDGGTQMESSADMLKQKSNEARGIVDVIINISSQTNLLALNASIEAARAGEAGKGFAVVADEIRNLSEQTKTETDHITSILNELINNANGVTDQVMTTVNLSTTESELAANTNKQFEHIKKDIDNLSAHIHSVEEKIDGLKAANAIIVDNVSTLSASSEEISASVTETCDVSAMNATLINQVANTIMTISDNVSNLKED